MAFRSSQTIAQVIAQSIRSRQGRKRTAKKDLQMLETNFFEGEGKKRGCRFSEARDKALTK